MSNVEIKCPKCGEAFTVDEAGYAAILKQVRDKEFAHELERQEQTYREKLRSEKKVWEAEMAKRQGEELSDLRMRIQELQALERELQQQIMLEKERTAHRLAEQKLQLEAAHRSEKESYEYQLRQKEDEITSLRDYRHQLSTKMLGESLEQHCAISFERVRAYGFPHAYFEKDNDAKSGSKGDFIFRDYTEDGVEYISIMFEMKNEMDTTATKHKNEDFFQKLDKDRREKGCEYAVLVSMLEADNEYYNDGIVDVSHRYTKMFVIRPQFFIPLISLLRNAAQNSVAHLRELKQMREQEIDVTNFQNAMNEFKAKFARNYQLASNHFKNAIAGIDKTIAQLQKTRDELVKTGDQLRHASDKAEDLSIKQLTKNSPSLAARFAELK